MEDALLENVVKLLLSLVVVVLVALGQDATHDGKVTTRRQSSSSNVCNYDFCLCY